MTFFNATFRGLRRGGNEEEESGTRLSVRDTRNALRGGFRRKITGRRYARFGEGNREGGRGFPSCIRSTRGLGHVASPPRISVIAQLSARFHEEETGRGVPRAYMTVKRRNKNNKKSIGRIGRPLKRTLPAIH